MRTPRWPEAFHSDPDRCAPSLALSKTRIAAAAFASYLITGEATTSRSSSITIWMCARGVAATKSRARIAVCSPIDRPTSVRSSRVQTDQNPPHDHRPLSRTACSTGDARSRPSHVLRSYPSWISVPVSISSSRSGINVAFASVCNRRHKRSMPGNSVCVCVPIIRLIPRSFAYCAT